MAESERKLPQPTLMGGIMTMRAAASQSAVQRFDGVTFGDFYLRSQAALDRCTPAPLVPHVNTLLLPDFPMQLVSEVDRGVLTVWQSTLNEVSADDIALELTRRVDVVVRRSAQRHISACLVAMDRGVHLSEEGRALLELGHVDEVHLEVLRTRWASVIFVELSSDSSSEEIDDDASDASDVDDVHIASDDPPDPVPEELIESAPGLVMVGDVEPVVVTEVDVVETDVAESVVDTETVLISTAVERVYVNDASAVHPSAHSWVVRRTMDDDDDMAEIEVRNDARKIAARSPTTTIRMLYLDAGDPHLYAGALVDQALDANALGRMRLSHMMTLITEPWLLSDEQQFSTILWLDTRGARNGVRLFVTGDAALDAIEYAESIVGTPNSAHFITKHDALWHQLQLYQHLRHLAEALFMQWVLTDVLPTNVWHAILLMYAARRAYLSVDRDGPAHLIRELGNAGAWDSVKQAYASASDSVSSAYDKYAAPTLERMSAALTRENLQALVDTLGAYASSAGRSVADSASRAYQATREYALSLKERLSPYSEAAAAKMREYAERVKRAVREMPNIDFAEIARKTHAYVTAKVEDVRHFLATDPRVQRYWAQAKAYAEEARRSGVDYWTYLKTLPEEARNRARTVMTRLEAEMVKAKGHMAQYIDTHLPEGVSDAIREMQMRYLESALAGAAHPEAEVERDAEQIVAHRVAEENPGFGDDGPPLDVPDEPFDWKQWSARPPRFVDEPVVDGAAPQSVDDDEFEATPAHEYASTNLPHDMELDDLEPPPLPPRDSSRAEVEASLDNQFVGLENWLLNAKGSDHYDAASVTSLLGLVHSVMGEESRRAGQDDHAVYRMLSTSPTNEEEALARYRTVHDAVKLTDRVLREALFDQNMAGAAHVNVGSTIDRMLGSGELSEAELDRLNAFVRFVDERNLVAQPLQGSFEETVGRRPGRADPRFVGARDLFAHPDTVHSDACSRGMRCRGAAQCRASGGQQLDGSTDVQEPVVGIAEILHDPHQHMMRSVTFHAARFGVKQLDAVVELASLELTEAHVKQKRLHVLHCDRKRWSATGLNARSAKQLHDFWAWLHSLGAMLELRARVDSVAQLDYEPWRRNMPNDARTLVVWNELVRPALASVRASHLTHGHHSDPFTSEQLEEGFSAVLRTGGRSIDGEELRAAYLLEFLDRLETPEISFAHTTVSDLRTSLTDHRVRRYMESVRVHDAFRSGGARVTMGVIVDMLDQSHHLASELRLGAPHTRTAELLELLAEDALYARSMIVVHHEAWATYMHDRITYALGIDDRTAHVLAHAPHSPAYPALDAQERALVIDDSPPAEEWSPHTMLHAEEVIRPTDSELAFEALDRTLDGALSLSVAKSKLHACRHLVHMDAYDRKHPTWLQVNTVAHEVMECDTYRALARVFEYYGLGTRDL